MNIIKDTSETRLSGFYVVYKGSTNLEDESNYGIAHLMEHLLCKNVDHMMDDFDRHAVDWNAYTSHNEVVFHISGKDEHVKKYKDEFYKNLSKFEITEEELENEKSIVESEYMNSFSDTMSAHFQMFMRKHYNHYNPIGELGCIRNIDMDKCNAFFEKQFKEPSFVVDISRENSYEMPVQESILSPKFDRKIQFLKDNEDYEVERFPQMLNTDSIIASREPITENIHLFKFASNILSKGLKSPLYDVIREQKGLVYSLGLGGMMITDQQIMPYFSTIAPKANVDAIKESLEFVHKNIEQMVTFDSFLRIKSSLKEAFDIRNIYSATNGQKYITPEAARLDNKLQGIKYTEIIDYIKEELDIENWHMSLSSDFAEE